MRKEVDTKGAALCGGRQCDFLQLLEVGSYRLLPIFVVAIYRCKLHLFYAPSHITVCILFFSNTSVLVTVSVTFVPCTTLV